MKNVFCKILFFVIKAICFVALVNMYKYTYKNNFKAIPTKRLKSMIIIYTIGEYLILLLMFFLLIWLMIQFSKQLKIK